MFFNIYIYVIVFKCCCAIERLVNWQLRIQRLHSFGISNNSLFKRQIQCLCFQRLYNNDRITQSFTNQGNITKALNGLDSKVEEKKKLKSINK